MEKLATPPKIQTRHHLLVSVLLPSIPIRQVINHCSMPIIIDQTCLFLNSYKWNHMLFCDQHLSPNTCFCYSSLSLGVLVIHSFFILCIFLSCDPATICISTYMLMDPWVVSRFGLLHSGTRLWCGHILLFSVG